MSCLAQWCKWDFLLATCYDTMKIPLSHFENKIGNMMESLQASVNTKQLVMVITMLHIGPRRAFMKIMDSVSQV